MRVPTRKPWDVEPYVRAGPFVAGSTLDDVIQVFTEEPSCWPRSTGVEGQRCSFPKSGINVGVDGRGIVEEICFGSRGSIAPVYRGVRLLGNWKSARAKLANMGFETPEPNSDEQNFYVTDGLLVGIRVDHVSPEAICVTLVRT